MATGFYIRRGQKTVGPISIEKIKANLDTGKIIPTDLVAPSPDGPWETINDHALQTTTTIDPQESKQVSPKLTTKVAPELGSSQTQPPENQKTRKPFLPIAAIFFGLGFIGATLGGSRSDALNALGGFCLLLWILFSIIGLADKYVTNRGVPVKPNRPLNVLSWLLPLLGMGAILLQLMIPAIAAVRRAAEESTIDAHRAAASQEASSYAIETDKQEPASVQNPQVVSGNTFEDFDYAFSLRRPSTNWQFLSEKNAAQLHPDAMMAMTGAKMPGFFAVIAEELEGSLDTYVHLIASNYGEDAVLGKESLEIDGRPAVKMTFKQTINGIEFRYVNCLLKKNDFAFQLVGWATASQFASVERDLEAIATSFAFAKDRQPRARSRVGIEDDYGFDWIIKDNVYSNASFGFRLIPANGMRLMGRDELMQINNAADAGLVSSQPATYHMYLVEKTKDDLIGKLISDWEKEMGVDSSGVQEAAVEFAGQDARQRVYHDIEIEGILFDWTWTYFLRDGVLYRYISWWPSSDRKDALPVFEKSLNQLSWLNGDQQRSLQQELSLLDANNAVGADYSLRNGVFRDFAGGYTYTLPSGLWKANAGDAALTENPECRLDIGKSDEGIYLQLIPEKDLDMSAEEYHRAILANFEVAADTPIEEAKSGTLDLKLSSFDTEHDGISLTWRLASAVRDNRYVQLLAWAVKDNESQLNHRLSELLQGLSLPENSPQAVKRTSHAIQDYRLGYQMSYKPDWKAEPTAHPSLGPIASMISVEHPRGAVIGMGVCTPMTDFTEDMMIDGMLRNSAIKLDPTTRVDSESTLAGLPARCVRFKGMAGRQSAQAAIWIARRGNTAYLLLALGEEGLDMEKYKQYFSLLD